MESSRITKFSNKKTLLTYFTKNKSIETFISLLVLTASFVEKVFPTGKPQMRSNELFSEDWCLPPSCDWSVYVAWYLINPIPQACIGLSKKVLLDEWVLKADIFFFPWQSIIANHKRQIYNLSLTSLIDLPPSGIFSIWSLLRVHVHRFQSSILWHQ